MIVSSRRRIRTTIWFLKRPKLYPQLLRLVAKKFVTNRSFGENTLLEASEWCAEFSVDTNTAIEQLTGIHAAASVENSFREVFDIAEAKARECPIEMGGPGDLDLIFWCAEFTRALRVIETGVAYGWSSLAILLSLKKRSGGILVSTDMPYPNLNNEQYVGCVVPSELRTNWKIIKRADKGALPKALRIVGSIDMCHYDSDKSYEGRMWAYPMLWAALRPGGFFISDDVGDNTAFRDFSKSVRCKPIIVRKENKYIGIMVKAGAD